MNTGDPNEKPTANSNGDTPGHEAMLDVILEFVNAPDWEASRGVLNRNPMLLSGQAMETFEALIQSYLAQGDLRLAYHLAIHRDLLRLAREVGYARAFELYSAPPSEQMVEWIAEFMQAEDWAASRGVLERRPDLLTHEANAAFQALIQAALEADDHSRLEALVSHHELLRAAQELGIDEAFRRAEAAAAGARADLMVLSVIGHNAIAVMLNETERRAEWLQTVRRLQRDARREGDAPLVALLSAVMKLLGGKPAGEIRPQGLDAAHRAVWEQIVAALGDGTATG